MIIHVNFVPIDRQGWWPACMAYMYLKPIHHHGPKSSINTHNVLIDGNLNTSSGIKTRTHHCSIKDLSNDVFVYRLKTRQFLFIYTCINDFTGVDLFTSHRFARIKNRMKTLGAFWGSKEKCLLVANTRDPKSSYCGDQFCFLFMPPYFLFWEGI